MNLLTKLTAILLFTLGLTACETIKGAGQDIENAGEEIDEEI